MHESGESASNLHPPSIDTAIRCRNGDGLTGVAHCLLQPFSLSPCTMPEKVPIPASPEKTLSDVLLQKAGVLSPQDTVQTAGEKMRSSGQESLPVAEERRLVGVIEHSSPDQEASRYGHDPARTTVAESMSRKITCCFQDEDCATALARMIENDLQQLPVVDRDMRIVGLVVREDLTGQPTGRLVSE
ncbi:MAG: hypothetical protein JWO08_3209 [Verrucomicrobiaceae bacterium]|nr:hypothetical protein [Verrucomicrobiaceae bacterium]